jgi:broad specificity phosphatase PhoE
VSTLVHVVRHGRTALNAQGRFRGLADPPLDEAGERGVAETALRLAGRHVSIVATSRLLRARQTADAVSLVTGVKPVVDPGLLDVDMGAWEGLTRAEAGERDPDAFAVYVRDPRAATVPGGDALADVETRIRSAVAALAAAHDGGEVVAVSHEAPIKLLVSAVLGVDGADVWALDLPTASLTTIHVDVDGWRIAER